MASSIIPGVLLPGAARLSDEEKGVNETYRGPIKTNSGTSFAYVKLLDEKQLTNELVASVLGRAIGLPIPAGFIVLVSRADYPDSEFLAAVGREHAFAFGVESIGHPDLKRRMKLDGDAAVEQLLKSWSGWCDAMVFDEWIANGDRNAGNLLIGGPGEVWLIDHGHAFTGPRWLPSSLDPAVAVLNEIARVVTPRLGLPERYAVLSRTGELAMDCGKVDAIEVLREGFAAMFASDEELEALRRFIVERVAHLVRLIANRVGLPVLLS